MYVYGIIYTKLYKENENIMRGISVDYHSVGWIQFAKFNLKRHKLVKLSISRDFLI